MSALPSKAACHAVMQQFGGFRPQADINGILVLIPRIRVANLMV